MLQDIESLIIDGVKAFLGKEVSVGELQALYAIYRDLKVIINGETNDKGTKEA